MPSTNIEHDDNNETTLNVTFIGIGSMGFGMASSCLISPSTCIVNAYDRNPTAITSFYEKSKSAGKTKSETPPQDMNEAVGNDTDVVVLVLVNETQCEEVCFEGETRSLLRRMKEGSCVLVCSTVTATWARKACLRFKERGIHFIDCPISGGPVRSSQGELTIMASDCDCLSMVMPLLQAMGKDVHIVKGGVGMGSTAKMVHQLLAGVHICAAAESLALAAKAGLDVEQMYQIVNGAAGASWMFADRGKRMIEAGVNDEVKSAVDIFVKDLDIIYSESKALKCPIPLASTSLQQFISAQGLGLGAKDDSQIVKVYEGVTGVPVRKLKKE